MGRPIDWPLVTVRMELKDVPGNVICDEIIQCPIGTPASLVFIKFLGVFMHNNPDYARSEWVDEDDLRHRPIMTQQCVLHGRAIRW